MATFKDCQCVQRVGNESHLSRLSSGLNQLRQQASFCDVSIIVGDQRFPAHKAVLSSTSDYFQGMFSSGFQESTMSEVTIPGTEESFAQILDFAYTGYFTLSLRTVVGIFRMTSFMVLTDAMELCAEYLREVKDNLTTEDCLEKWSIASDHGSLLGVAQMYKSHLLQNFPKCIESQAFLKNSSASDMIEFLGDAEIETSTITEEQILQAALIWLKFDWEQRKVHAGDILKEIRLGLVPLVRLKEILGDDLLSISECEDMVDEVVKLIVTKETASPPLIISHPELFATRNTITARLSEDKNYDDSSSAPIVSLICKTKTACHKISKLADIPNRYPYSEERGACVTPFVSSKNQLYVVLDIEYVGQDAEDTKNHKKWLAENNFFQYMAETNEWIALPPAPKVVHVGKIWQIEEYIFLLGECDSRPGSRQSIIQRFEIQNKSWEILMNDIPFFTDNASVLSSGKILIKGIQHRAGPNLDGHPYGFSVVAVALYKPATNQLLDVSVDTEIHSRRSFFVEHDNNCYMVTRCRNKATQINRVICDFDSDEPTMTFADVVENEALDRDDHFYPEFTFDAHKFGLV